MTTEETKAVRGSTGLTIKDLKDVRNAWRTASLFAETCDDPVKYPPVYSLGDQHGTLPSLKRNFLDLGDLAEYTFAETYLGGWDHWQRITESWVLKPHVEMWRTELRLKLEAEAIATIKEIASGTGPSALQAAKYLYEKVNSGESRKRGRPSKAEKDAALKKELRDSEDVAADAARIGIRIVK